MASNKHLLEILKITKLSICTKLQLYQLYFFLHVLRFISPLMAALICLLFFVIIRTCVLRRQNSTNISFWVLPLLLVFTIWVNLFFVLVRWIAQKIAVKGMGRTRGKDSGGEC